ncbi:hypothetical protein PsAD46_04037 [Pseudovibrio sp. Ad46]|uniref:hypothetical protein n=1 Tax=Pseudovibrio sp. Ad46 TaxID=989432 RepID=UPI0007AE8B95|nr:hypothetical protein [Pseudovibrio sp. Ad46]KZK80048.1 hypothetical protein PsAD46_04037 [Pseudovibrio sp. Ad46]
MEDNENSLPRLVHNVDPARVILKSIRDGVMPAAVKAKHPDIDVDHIYKSLQARGLIDHIEIILNSPGKGSEYYLTDKGQRWLQTYDYWERVKFKLSKWQLLGGIIFGISINFVSNLIWPLLPFDFGQRIKDDQGDVETYDLTAPLDHNMAVENMIKETPSVVVDLEGAKGSFESFSQGLYEGMGLFGFAFPFITTAILVWVFTVLFTPIALSKIRSKSKAQAQTDN